jgi:hypothetical protein
MTYKEPLEYQEGLIVSQKEPRRLYSSYPAVKEAENVTKKLSTITLWKER